MRLAWVAALACMVQTQPQGGEGLEPWSRNHHPSDQSKRRVEEVAEARHAYTIVQGGTMDGTNCRSPIGVGMGSWPALEQTWESNRAVRMENVGEADVVNPWLSNGRNCFRTLSEIATSALEPGMTDREKAMALWFQEIRFRFHMDGDNSDLGDPVKVYNVYGYNTCGNDSICVAGLWKKAGLKVAPARLVGHCVSQVFYDKAWHLFDGDMHSMYLLRDGLTVAGEQDLRRDHDLIRRSHTQGILKPDIRGDDEWESSIYIYEGEVNGDRNCGDGTSMNMTLRPGEAVTWRWGHLNPLKHHGASKPHYPDTVANGLWEYRPDFAKEAWKKGAASVEGIRASGGELTPETDRPGQAVWILKSPYVFVGGKIESEGSGVKFSISFDGKTWEDAAADLDRFFPPAGAARYEFRIRGQLEPGAHLRSLRLVGDLQMAPLSLPGLRIGSNEMVYTDQTQGPRKVRITHEWVERSASKPPEAPPQAVFPPDGGETPGTEIVFKWGVPKDPDGDKIVDYHFELGDRPDLKWPLSTNFYKLISKTADQGKAQYTLPAVGLLAPDHKYYWHVRARDEKGVWGPWSKAWGFTARGPVPPVDLSLEFDAARGTGLLKWKPASTGRKPAKYRIYGSDELGFTASDAPYKVTVGISKDVSPNAASNFVLETSATEAAVVGRDLAAPAANRAFYRVIAVDDQGVRSGPSDFTSAPRAFISTKPVTQAKVGAEYRYRVSAIRSLGDLRTRVVDGREVMNFWDIEKPRYAIVKGPAWLKIDPDSGVLSGTPDQPGKVAVALSASIDREARTLDERALSWGVEKVVSTAPQKVGAGTQEFTLEVLP